MIDREQVSVRVLGLLLSSEKTLGSTQALTWAPAAAVEITDALIAALGRQKKKNPSRLSWVDNEMNSLADSKTGSKWFCWKYGFRYRAGREDSRAITDKAFETLDEAKAYCEYEEARLLGETTKVSRDDVFRAIRHSGVTLSSEPEAINAVCDLLESKGLLA